MAYYQPLSTIANFDYGEVPIGPGQIRLLRVPIAGDTLQGADHRLACGLISAVLGKHPVFSALSYTWGDENSLVEITIEGKIMRITKNLEDALESFKGQNTRPAALGGPNLHKSERPNGEGDANSHHGQDLRIRSYYHRLARPIPSRVR